MTLSLLPGLRAAEKPSAVNPAPGHTFATYASRKVEYYSSSNRNLAGDPIVQAEATIDDPRVGLPRPTTSLREEENGPSHRQR
jgi:hypothetical protein